MSITATTLSAAIDGAETRLGLASVSAISAPNPATGTINLLAIDQEIALVTGLPGGTQVNVQRGYMGTRALSHGASVPVLIGTPSDFASFVPAQGITSVLKPQHFLGVGVPQSGATITVDGDLVHFSGTTQLATITVPDGLVGGEVTLVFDGSGAGLTWSAGGNINVAGTSTTAGSSVTFRYDRSISKWIPSRLA